MRLSLNRAPVLLGIAALLMFTVALGRSSLWDTDEALYAQVAREIVQSGDAVTLHYNGRPWFVHPPLYMWLVALTGSVFGFSEFVVRIWIALSGVAGVLVTFLLGRRLYDGRTGVLAGVILMTTAEYFTLSRLAVFDLPLLVFMLLVLSSVLAAMDAGSPAARRRAYRWAAVWAGLGTLTKGPIALLLPGMVIAVWWVVRGEWRRRWRELPWEGGMLYALIGLSWYGVQTWLHGRAFLSKAVGYYLFTRFFGVVDNQPGPAYYYLPILIAGGFPWSAFLPGAVAYFWRQRQDRYSTLLLLWMGITFLFYSLAGTKLANYIVPVFPVMAIAIARLTVAALWEGESRAASLLRWGLVLLPILLAGIAIRVAAVPKTSLAFDLIWPAVRPFIVLPVAAAGAVVGLLVRRSFRAAFAALVATMIVLYGILVLVALPQVEPLRPRALALALRERVPPGARVVAVGTAARPSLLFYSGDVPRWVADAAAARRAICGSGEAYLVTTRREYEKRLPAVFGRDLTVFLEGLDLVLLRKDRFIPCASP